MCMIGKKYVQQHTYTTCSKGFQLFIPAQVGSATCTFRIVQRVLCSPVHLHASPVAISRPITQLSPTAQGLSDMCPIECCWGRDGGDTHLALAGLLVALAGITLGLEGAIGARVLAALLAVRVGLPCGLRGQQRMGRQTGRVEERLSV